MTKKTESSKTSTSFTVGAIALVFLAIGYQTALFIHKAAVATIVANHDRPDTVYVYDVPPDWEEEREYGDDGNDSRARYHGTGNGRQYREGRQYQEGRQSQEGRQYQEGRQRQMVRRSSGHSDAARRIVQQYGERSYESFPFDPNTVTVDDLMRLGFSQKQAQSIDNYRKSGGRFRRKEDFAKSYVVDDSVYRRLERFISIPKLDINKADSTAFDSLPGIGGYFASRMVSYRERLGGYSYAEQLMDIPRFDQEKYDQLKDLVTVGPGKPYRLWSLPEDSLSRHPYLDRHSAHSIVLFRENSPRSQWTVEALAKAGILSPDQAVKLGRCRIAGAGE